MSQVSLEESHSPHNLLLWFQRIHNEIDFLMSSIDKKEGVFIFKTHSYAEDQLLSSPSMERIKSTVGQLETMFNSWVGNDNVSDELAKLYWDNRLSVERKLGELRARIIERKPTFWESIERTISRFIKFIMAHIPMLPELIRNRISESFSTYQKRLSSLTDLNSDDV